MDPLGAFGPATRRFVESAFAQPTRVQREGWPVIARGEHALLFAPTGSGKTLAAFLTCIDRLTRLPPATPREGIRALYVSPLKALVYDVEKNLRAPLIGVARAGEGLNVPLREVHVAVRTGDTASKERVQQVRHPADVLVTTPESLYLMLTSGARDVLRTVDTVIVDEIHAVAGTKRGVHLALSLERLAHLTGRDPQRIGLSATQRPLEAIARYLGGDRAVNVVDASEAPRLSLSVEVPGEAVATDWGGAKESAAGSGSNRRRRSGPLLAVASEEDRAGAPARRRTQRGGTSDSATAGGMWPILYPAIVEKVRAHRSTIVFVNSRLLCERLAQRLNEVAQEELALAHHGSLSHKRRAEIEDQLKQGKLRCLVATSSLELGVDMGAVDLVILVESPGAASRGLQRVGRAGHAVGQTSTGVIMPKFKGDLLECAVVGKHMLEGKLEPTRVPERCLDVLAQHIVAMVAMDAWRVPDLLTTLRRASPYAELSREVLDATLDMLSGKYPSHDFADLIPRIVWDRTEDRLTPRRGARALALLNAGTIPDRGLFGVHVGGGEDGKGGPRIGELDEEMVYETRRGDAIVLGASTWRVEEISRDRVIVTPAPGEAGRLPFWRGEAPRRPVDVGRALGAFLRQFDSARTVESVEAALESTPLDGAARVALAKYIVEQREHTGTLPTDRAITVESFRDELGDWRVCVLSPLGSRVHAAWAQCLQAKLADDGAGGAPQLMWTDDGLALRFVDGGEPPDLSVLFPDPDDVDELLLHALPDTSLFAARFRENAARALLLPRRGFKGRTPLWLQRKRGADLLSVAQKYPSFPLVLETFRECLQDALDVGALKELLTGVKSRAIRVDTVETKKASPFARSLVFAYVAAYLYDGDAPLSERRAQALALDRSLLAELLGQDELRELIDPRAVDEVRTEVALLDADRRAHHADAVHDLLRRLGDLTRAEIAQRTDGDAGAFVDELVRARRAVDVRVGGEARVVAVEDAARYRDALGTPLPAGIPDAFLAKSDAGALEGLVARYARTHGPFRVDDVAARFGLLPGQLEPALAQLQSKGLVVAGTVHGELCDADVLRRLKRRTLAKLRDEVAPVDGPAFARFLEQWHGIGSPRPGIGRLEEAIVQLEGVPLAWSVLEREILPARVSAFDSALLDELGAMGSLSWIGAGALGKEDGRVRLYRRDRVALLVDPPSIDAVNVADDDGVSAPVLGPTHRAVLAHLETKGASFAAELLKASGLPGTKELMELLWDLAWAGLVTNDTFAPLRGLRAKSSARRPRHVAMLGGRWAAVSQLAQSAAPSSTERLMARALALLERCGVVPRESAEHEPGGFSALYPVLRALEESGRARRGHFVEGLTGAQFALPGAVERLRAARDAGADAVRIYSAVDPALPWGASLAWPDVVDGQTPKRIAGARVVVVGGRPVLYVERGDKSMLTFPAARDDGPDLSRAVKALLEKQDYKSLRIARVDGADAELAEAAPALLRAGFQREHPGLVLSR